MRDPYLWRELRADFAATPLPAEWSGLRTLIEDRVRPRHGMSAGSVHLPWWVHTAIPMLLDRYAAVTGGVRRSCPG